MQRERTERPHKEKGEDMRILKIILLMRTKEVEEFLKLLSELKEECENVP